MVNIEGVTVTGSFSRVCCGLFVDIHGELRNTGFTETALSDDHPRDGEG